MSKLTNREIITVKLEVTYGTDPIPVGTDAVLVENLNVAFEGARMNERPAIRTSFGKLKQIFGGHLVQVTFDVELKGSGVAGTAPEIGALLQACGLSETVVAVTSVTYAPVSSALKSVTIYYYEDGILYKITGCRGTFSLNAETGSYGKLSFTMTGHLSATPTDTALVTPTYDSTVPVALINIPFAIGAYAAVINAVTMDLAAQVVMPPKIQASDGYGEIQIVGRDPKGTFDPESVLIATEAFYNKWVAGTAFALDSGAVGAAAGNIWRLQMPGIYYREMSRGNRDGIRTYEMGYAAAETTTDNEFSLAFT